VADDTHLSSISESGVSFTAQLDPNLDVSNGRRQFEIKFAFRNLAHIERCREDLFLVQKRVPAMISPKGDTMQLPSLGLIELDERVGEVGSD